MVRVMCALFVSAALSGAPFQCSTDPDPEHAIEETPGEALYRLAEEFRAAGNHAAERRTLEYLIEHYPSSRFAIMAKEDLER